MGSPDRSDLQHPGLSGLNNVAKAREATRNAAPRAGQGAGHAGTFGSGDLVGEDASARRGPVEQSAGTIFNPLIGR